jgi:hypothetical protein
MVVVKIELWPGGSEEHKEEIGSMKITNKGATEDGKFGRYFYELFKSKKYSKSEGVWKKGEMHWFPRLTRGPYDILYRVLKEAVGSRNDIDEEKIESLEKEYKKKQLF